MRLNRRRFLQSTGALAVIPSLPAAGTTMPAVTASVRRTASPMTIIMHLRGGADGLALVTPYRHPAFYDVRPTTLCPPPGSGDGALLDLDGTFGLHPGLGIIHNLLRRGSGTIVHAVGRPSATRSHFIEQDAWAQASDEPCEHGASWVAHRLASGRTRSVDPANPLVLTADGVWSDLDDHPGRASLAALHRTMCPAWMPTDENPSLRDKFTMLMQLMAHGVRPDFVGVAVDGWDTHRDQRHRLDASQDLMRELRSALIPFLRQCWRDPHGVRLLLVSEFGRSLRENTMGGTDHGDAGVVLVLDNTRRFDRPVDGRLPDLRSAIDGGAVGLPAMTDFREVLRRYASACC